MGGPDRRGRLGRAEVEEDEAGHSGGQFWIGQKAFEQLFLSLLSD